MKIGVALMTAIGIGFAVGAAAVAGIAWLSPVGPSARRAMYLVVGLVFSIPILQATFSRSLFGPVTLSARMLLAIVGAVSCYAGAVAIDTAEGARRALGHATGLVYLGRRARTVPLSQAGSGVNAERTSGAGARGGPIPVSGARLDGVTSLCPSAYPRYDCPAEAACAALLALPRSHRKD